MVNTLRNRYFSVVWAILRIFLGYVWLSAAFEKLGSFSAYVGSHAGTAVSGYLHGALAQTTGAHPQVTSVWAWLIHVLFLPTAGFWSVVVTFGELLVGIALVLGVLTGTALMGALVMNMAYMLSGSATTNPVMFALEAGMLVLGPVAAYWGLDHWLFHDWNGRRLLFHPAISRRAMANHVPDTPTPTAPRHTA
jgi:thiosulfate dehydrogenase [quinone] large subunit